ncbi:hypothetical protein [Sulfuracidifex tepidarius]|uniref:Uncharacterized protein n=1 Tax=Sulfuracidifex tepidarius TaxID=1294262 RepID=A0A510E119_9CREN|nr:hypothetical protein [Sulfuracidifex tepidarius]BBG23035.1 hypothetical protein IC006_0319 [Sulfuracidifex tepidarius]BBG25798.1 hypothetical protein IC007_0303 [Sulfuracidifex tepidarius]
MDILEFPLDREYLTISSAIYPEGISKVNKVVLGIVPHNYDSVTPVKDVMSVCDCRSSLVFMTAARKHIMKDEGISCFS